MKRIEAIVKRQQRVPTKGAGEKSRVSPVVDLLRRRLQHRRRGHSGRARGR